MSILKIKAQDFELLRKTHPDLYTMINTQFSDLAPNIKGKIAGLCIEYVIKSNGDVDIFQEDLEVDEQDLNDEYDEVNIN